MAGGGLAVAAAGGVEFEAKITPIVIISCIMAATGGLMFGYDVGVSGGVTAMPDFLKKFFPVVYRKTEEGKLATFFASYTTRRLGRRLTMLIAGVFFIFGVIFNAAAVNLAMLIVGRILLGCGVGFANQAVPVFLSEIAPTRIRGGLNILFQLNVTIGILFANLVNYGTAKIEGGWGWRLSLGLAGIPALMLTVGALLVVDTPNSLIERGKLEEGKAVLRKIRGTDNVEPEYLELVEASRIAKEVKHPFRNLLLLRKNRPPLIISIALQFFQQFTGINAIMFYAPVLFSTLGFGNDASLYSTVITGAVNVLSTIVSIYSVDKLGRRILLLEAGVQMFFAQVVIAIILGIKVTETSDNLSTGFAVLVVIMVCTFISAFAWSWGPLGWLIPSETFPLETRSAGQSITVCINLVFTFVIAQAFLSMLCHFKFGIFLFFSGWVLIMSIFVWFLVPETKNIPIEEMTERVWKRHWLWKRFMDDDDEYVHHDDLAKKNGFVGPL
ncbi:unnamed protein product [Lactuca saligna]|uniref:Major facilitator superfamily (MFS) profile domain-containing protein n=1 Tax=Lactuca saligna TaxID=75948 RepID=A0AA35Z8L1_LACSI|nr:unnamed protein product [Lactuca saligna]